MGRKDNAGNYGISWGRLFRRLSFYNLKKGLNYLRFYGWKAFRVRLSERFEPEEIPYVEWQKGHLPDEEELEAQRRAAAGNPLKFSIIVPAYQTPEPFLREMIESVQAQTYGNWELCIADGSPGDGVGRVVAEYCGKDDRIFYQKLENNSGIAGNTNAAFAMASGAFVGLLDHDDTLAPDALYEASRAVGEAADVDVIYSDEDKLSADSKEYFQPHFKPDFNLDLLRSNNYICHFFLARTSLLEKVGGFDRAFDGAQDYDFIFRCTEQARRIVHIPRILYHWRVHKASTAENPASKLYAFQAGQRAIEAHLQRSGCGGEVLCTEYLGFYRVKYPLAGRPLVSIVIPNKDQREMLQKCLESLGRSAYDHYEVIIVENNSQEEETFGYYRQLEGRGRIRVLRWEGEFNYSAINNFGVSQARGDYIVLMNNDIALMGTQWLEEMLSVCQRPEVGIVGAKLYYPNGAIQHAGTVLGIGGIAGNLFVNMPGERSGYLHKASLLQDLTAVTAALLMVKREVYEQVKGFDEALKVAFNDVDFCLRVREQGWLVVYDPYVEACHYESRTRGHEDTREKARRFQSEIDYMRKRWIQALKQGDPNYNRNLTLKDGSYKIGR